MIWNRFYKGLRIIWIREKRQTDDEFFKRILTNPEVLTDPIVHKVGCFFSENIHHGFNLEELAEVLSMNKDYLGKQLKEKTGMDFRTLYNRLKVEYAKPLIQSGVYKIYEISDLQGYSSADYFSKIFKNVTGMTPAEMKKISIKE